MTYYLLTIIVLTISASEAFLASNKIIMTGNVSFVCAFFRKKDYAIDDISMPEILTFCSCVIIHNQFALTARQCYVQTDWFVAPITTRFTNQLPDQLHTIENVFDRDELTLVQVQPNFFSDIINLTPESLKRTKNCDLYGFSPPNNKPVTENADRLIYKVWHMEGDLLKAEVQTLPYKECKKKHNNHLSEYKMIINEATLCINPLDKQYLEPCSFDRGAPIVCDGALQGILIYQRPLLQEIPLHLPTGCYGMIKSSLSIYAESLTANYNDWIQDIIIKYT